MFVAQQVGRYHLLDRIAFGGMAEIFRAKTFDSQGQEHMVAIKRVLRHLSDDDDFLQMLVDEAKIASLLDHTNIAKVYEFVRVGDDYFISMEYVDGKDSRTVLDRCRAEGLKLAPEHCAYILMRVLEGLHSAHEKHDGAGTHLNIVHRDVSPSNIIISYSGLVKLCDFGIAKATLSRVQTRTGVIKGKVKYMSPEQAMGHPLDRRSDLFSAGSVLYELLTLQPPFQAENEMELVFRVRDAKYQRPTKLCPETHLELERIVKKALSRSTATRYQTAAEFAVDLRHYLQAEHPDYSPGRLGRFVRKMFAEEIEKDLRLLEDFVFDKVDPSAVGQNLLAEVLGEGAAYTKFTPVGPDAVERHERTKLMPRVPPPEERLPSDVDLHDMKTEILDLEEREHRVRKRRRRPKPGATYHKDKDRGTEQATLLHEVEGGAESKDGEEVEIEVEIELEGEEVVDEIEGKAEAAPGGEASPDGGSDAGGITDKSVELPLELHNAPTQIIAMPKEKGGGGP
jgi:eukaryotic-like serine/threonine-protein kinase